MQKEQFVPMKTTLGRLVVALGLTVGVTGVASAQVTVSLPDTSQTTLMTAIVAEQARVVVPATVTFNVANVSNATAAAAASVTVDNIVLATATKQLRVSLRASAANFTPPVVGGTTWAASDVTWNGATWSNASGTAGTLDSAITREVATCVAGTSSCATTGLVFTLAAKPTVNVSGNHTLSVIWRFESIGS